MKKQEFVHEIDLLRQRPSKYRNIKRKDGPIRVIEGKQVWGWKRRETKENGATQCSRGRRGEEPFVGHTSGPPWRLIACNALLTCLASSYRQRRAARKTRVARQQNPTIAGTRCYVRNAWTHTTSTARTATPSRTSIPSYHCDRRRGRVLSAQFALRIPGMSLAPPDR